MQVKNLAISQISEDRFFQFRFSPIPSSLPGSIKHSGVLSPILVFQHDDIYQVVSGFQRLEASLQLHIDKISCHVYDNPEKIHDIFYTGLLDHISIHSLKLIEKARILHILFQLDLESNEWSPFLQLLDLPDNPNLLEEVRSILTCDSQMITYLETYDLSLKQTLPFVGFSKDVQKKLARIGLDMQIRGVELLNIGALIDEISRRNETSFSDIWNKLEVDHILKDDTHTRSQRIDQLKKQLNSLRYPKLTKWQNEIQNAFKSMQIPENVQMHWDASLEKSGLQLQVRLTDISDVDALIVWMDHPQNKSKWNQLFGILK